jgi:hypothetical protein
MAKIEEAVGLDKRLRSQYNKVEVVLEDGINRENLNRILDEIMKMHGCTNCGLAGIDLSFRIRDRFPYEKIADIKELVDISFQRDINHIL